MTTIKASNDNGSVNVSLGLSPLARAALDCGVSFDDVHEYMHDLNKQFSGQIYEAVIESERLVMRETESDILIDTALNRSHAASSQGRIAGARPFWHNI